MLSPMAWGTIDIPRVKRRKVDRHQGCQRLRNWDSEDLQVYQSTVYPLWPCVNLCAIPIHPMYRWIHELGFYSYESYIDAFKLMYIDYVPFLLNGCSKVIKSKWFIIACKCSHIQLACYVKLCEQPDLYIWHLLLYVIVCEWTQVLL